ncbi:MAG: DUF4861 domain-containing protein [Bacteroidetes bacterium]|nr:DUF4861 domain-containing protein [Bacteroidota bacterium]
MNRKLFSIVLPIIFTLSACLAEMKQIEIKVANPSDLSRKDELVSLGIADIVSLDKGFNVNNFSLFDGEVELPYQIEKTEGSENNILTVVDFAPTETKTITIKYGAGSVEKSFIPRTYSELSMKEGNVFFDSKYHGDHFTNVTDIKVPDNHTDHNALFKYEGPGWESELVGYRFYIDWRNATDIFGKKKLGLILQNVGVTDTVAKDDSYHEMQDWGMDVFKVGNTLGIGSPGMMHDSKVNRVEKRDSVFCNIKTGPVKSLVQTKYMGWKVGDKKYDFTSTLSICAGSRLTLNEMSVNNDADNLVTGLAKYDGCSYTEGKFESGWNYIALYGKQTLVDDNMGIAVIYPVASLKEILEDDINYLVVLNPSGGKADYYFGAAWEQEPGGIKSEKEFISYLNQTVEKLNSPIVVEY